MGRREKKASGPQPSRFRPEPEPVPEPVFQIERRRWSFHRDRKVSDPTDRINPRLARQFSESEVNRAMAVAVATAAAADAAAAAAATQAAAAARAGPTTAAAIKIQAIFRSYLARKALCALKGLVKIQAMVRGHLVRKQATATLRCMQALVMAQSRARAHRLRAAEPQHPFLLRRLNDPGFQLSYETDRSVGENVKIVEMDRGEPRSSLKGRNSFSTTKAEEKGRNLSTHYSGLEEQYQDFSPSPSSITDLSSMKGYSEQFEESNPRYSSSFSVPDAMQASYNYPFLPNFMVNTESSRAKARSRSAPRQRPDSTEGQSSRRRASVELKNNARSAKLQKSSSLNVDKSSMSIKDFGCGLTSTVITDTTNCRSLVAYKD